MFKRKNRARNGNASPSPSHSRPGSDGSQHAAPRLPDKEYRTSLILRGCSNSGTHLMTYGSQKMVTTAALASRFDLLREKDGSLVPYERMKSALRAQRETGYLNEEEEEALLFHFKLQAMKEGQTLPPSATSSPSGMVASPSWPSIASRSSQGSYGESDHDHPTTLADFHKMRRRAQSSASLFASSTGMETRERLKANDVPPVPRRKQSASTPNSSPARRSEPPSPEFDPIPLPALRMDEKGSDAPTSPNANTSPFEFPRNMPIARALALQPSRGQLTMTPDQIQRISRVLDDIELDFTGTLMSSSTGSFNAETTGVVSPKTSSESRAFADDTEAIDPGVLKLARKMSTKGNWQGPRLSTVESEASPVDPIFKESDYQSTDPSQSGLVTPTPPSAATLGPPNLPCTPQSLLQTPSPSLAPPADIGTSSGTSPYTVFQTMFPSPSDAQPWPKPLRHHASEDMIRYWAAEPASIDADKSDSDRVSSDSKEQAHQTKPSLSSNNTSSENDCLFSPKFNASSSSLLSEGSSYCADDQDAYTDSSEELPSFSSAESEKDSDKRRSPFEFDDHLEHDTPNIQETQILGGLQIQDLAYLQSELVRSASQRAHERSLAQSQASSRNSGFSVTADSSLESTNSHSNAEKPVVVPSKPTGDFMAEENGTPALTTAHNSPLSETHNSLPPTPATQSASPLNTAGQRMQDLQNRAHLPNKTSGIRPKSPPPPRPMSPVFVPLTNNMEQTMSTPRPVSPPLPVPQPRTNPSTIRSGHTQSVLIRDVAAQAQQATAVLKGDPLSTPKAVKRRKSSKNLVISPPQLLSSSINLARLQERDVLPAHQPAQPSINGMLSESVPPLPTKTDKLRARSPQRNDHSQDLQPSDIPGRRPTHKHANSTDASPVLGHFDSPSQSPLHLSPQHNGRTDSQQSFHHNEPSPSGLHRLLTRLRRKKDKDKDGMTKDSHSPSFLPPGARHIQPFSPHLLQTPTPELQQSSSPVASNTSAFLDVAPSPLLPDSPLSTSTISSRAPVQYNVGNWRKRAHSVSSNGSNSTPPKLSNTTPTNLDAITEGNTTEHWIPPDPETSMASWRDSILEEEEEERPFSSSNEESLQKLRAAASALGLDPIKVDALVADAKIPDSRRHSERLSVIRRTIIIPSRPTSENRSREEYEMEGDESTEESEEDLRLRSVHDRAPTPPPAHQHHTRRVSHDYIMEHPIPSSPLHTSLQQSPVIQTSAGTTKPINDDALDDAFDDADESGDVVIARGNVDGENHTVEISAQLDPDSAQQPKDGNDRLEIDELSDGSLVWQVVRNLRHTSVLSDLDFYNNNHSRQSSVESAIIPARTPLVPTPLRLPSRKIAQDMRLVISKTHKRVRSNEKGVGNLGYIKSPSMDIGPIREEAGSARQSVHHSDSAASEVEVYQAEEAMVSNLIEDLTSGMESGSFNLVRATSIQRLTRARQEREKKRAESPVMPLRLGHHVSN